MDFFEYVNSKNKEKDSPLAYRLRPRTIDEVIGQRHIIGKDKMLYRAIKADKLSSAIFYGPAGTGKTTLAMVIANTTQAVFAQINASISGKKDMEEVVDRAKEVKAMTGKKTILFVDEIHRFNKSQQDFLLPYVEDGTVILIGATTENPYFEVNQALLSRSLIFQLEKLSKKDLILIIDRAINDDKGMMLYHAKITEEAKDFLADFANGDARAALNAVELGVLTTEPDSKGEIVIDIDVARECIQKRGINYDKSANAHYDTVSAFIKSMRGSDPDAAVYYLARMLYGGEDIKFIARRIMICASEDVGNADPLAMLVASSAALEVERVGMPESQLILAQAAIYIASAPKSNACTNAIYAAMEAVKKTTACEIPAHLRDGHYSGANKLGNAIGYKYAHDYDEHYVPQQYLPDDIEGSRFYIPTEIGREKEIRDRLNRFRNRKDREE